MACVHYVLVMLVAQCGRNCVWLHERTPRILQGQDRATKSRQRRKLWHLRTRREKDTQGATLTLEHIGEPPQAEMYVETQGWNCELTGNELVAN